MRYKTVKAGEWVQPKREALLHEMLRLRASPQTPIPADEMGQWPEDSIPRIQNGWKMSHEQSETIERNGKFFNVYGRETRNAGLPLPGETAYDTMEEAVAGAKRRSESFDKENHGIIERSMGGMFDALHPNGTGTTKRGFSDIYPRLGK